MRGTMQKYYIGFAVIAVICLIAILWQYTLSRDATSDQRKVTDISELQRAADLYSSENGEAPSNLKQLQLNEKLKTRLDDYEYSHNNDSYTICATFKTDASLSGSSYSSLESDPYYHKKGRQCFTSKIYSYNLDDSYNPQDYNDFYNQDFNFDSLYQ